jgi:aspartyl-tRNA(Asn)/glutamyl-tRNA(Gln) amidotransferase subunit C
LIKSALEALQLGRVSAIFRSNLIRDTFDIHRRLEQSMSVDKNTVAKIARLARIRVDEKQQEELTGELNQILGWIEQLSELDTDGVEPMTSVVEMTQPLREDVVNDGYYVDRVTKNAPESAHGFYAVPKVVE